MKELKFREVRALSQDHTTVAGWDSSPGVSGHKVLI